MKGALLVVLLFCLVTDVDALWRRRRRSTPAPTTRPQRGDCPGDRIPPNFFDIGCTPGSRGRLACRDPPAPFSSLNSRDLDSVRRDATRVSSTGSTSRCCRLRSDNRYYCLMPQGGSTGGGSTGGGSTSGQRAACPGGRVPSGFHDTGCRLPSPLSLRCSSPPRVSPWASASSSEQSRMRDDATRALTRDTSDPCCVSGGQFFCRHAGGGSTGGGSTGGGSTGGGSTGGGSTGGGSTGGGSTGGGSVPTRQSPASGPFTAREREMFAELLAYRTRMGKSNRGITLDGRLTEVARVHVEDLRSKNPDRGGCNMHSWSDNPGRWAGCCYRNGGPGSCMWSKPKEIAGFNGNGFENALGMHGSQWVARASPREMIHEWSTSPGHNQVMINDGVWSRYTWNSVGVAANDNYALLWFSDASN